MSGSEIIMMTTFGVTMRSIMPIGAGAIGIRLGAGETIVEVMVKQLLHYKSHEKNKNRGVMLEGVDTLGKQYYAFGLNS